MQGGEEAVAARARWRVGAQPGSSRRRPGTRRRGSPDLVGDVGRESGGRRRAGGGVGGEGEENERRRRRQEERFWRHRRREKFWQPGSVGEIFAETYKISPNRPPLIEANRVRVI